MIEFRGVTFAYDSESDGKALQDMSFQVPRGGSLAIVGTTGAGKTTISRLLLRLYDPTAGQVLINGQDVKNVTQNSLRTAIGVVPQDVVLFNATIRYNIRYGCLGASDEAVHRAATNAQLSDFIGRQTEGYETLVGERGLKLSGGERQRLAIARCILKDPPIVVLDEATSALDTQTEQRVQQGLNLLSRDRTVLAITHRLSTIRNFDQVLVLERGQIVEHGTHDELLVLGGRYSHMWAAQEAAELIGHKAVDSVSVPEVVGTATDER